MSSVSRMTCVWKVEFPVSFDDRGYSSARVSFDLRLNSLLFHAGKLLFHQCFIHTAAYLCNYNHLLSKSSFGSTVHRAPCASRYAQGRVRTLQIRIFTKQANVLNNPILNQAALAQIRSKLRSTREFDGRSVSTNSTTSAGSSEVPSCRMFHLELLLEPASRGE